MPREEICLTVPLENVESINLFRMHTNDPDGSSVYSTFSSTSIQLIYRKKYRVFRTPNSRNNRKVKKQEIWHINYPDGISFRNFNIVSQTTFKDGYAYLFGLIAGPNNRNLYLIQIDSLSEKILPINVSSPHKLGLGCTKSSYICFHPLRL